MAKTERQILEESIESLAAWRDGRAITSVQHTFLQLGELDQSENEELWAELRKTLATNSHLNRPRNKSFLLNLELAGQGNWWWNPAEWTVENEELKMRN